MLGRKGIVTLRGPGTAWAASFPLLAALGRGPGPLFAVGVPLALVLFTPGALRLRPEHGPATALSATVFGGAYPGALLSFAVLLREMGDGRWEGLAIVFFPLLVVWVGDTAAYFVGRSLGRRPLAPQISPRKTWEGALAGLVGSVLCAAAYAPVARAAGAPFSVAWAAALGGAVGVFGQMGDLFESVLKRDCGVKDSSGLFPGHGGALDRVDALLFAFPVTYLLLRLAWG